MSGSSDTANSFLESESESETDPEVELTSESEYPDDFSKVSNCLFPILDDFSNIGMKSDALLPEINQKKPKKFSMNS